MTVVVGVVTMTGGVMMMTVGVVTMTDGVMAVVAYSFLDLVVIDLTWQVLVHHITSHSHMLLEDALKRMMSAAFSSPTSITCSSQNLFP